MKRNLALLTLSCLLLSTTPLKAQEETNAAKRSQSVYLEFAGSGCALTVNYEFRLKKERISGLGLRIGAGGLAIDLFGTTSVFSVPTELNYIWGEKTRVSGEIGFSLTYLHIRDETISWFFDEPDCVEKEDLLVSYIPLGIRFRPKTNGLLVRLNAGPVINYSSPNLWSDHAIDPFLGIAVGYSFMK
ncbi:hypothetical protein [Sunxiuqinia rutila]|uniref:hypothetical protein n=1 Tax=Sunxiuqinia rutila TaxID=1397841 RepID=UPI003D363A75